MLNFLSVQRKSIYTYVGVVTCDAVCEVVDEAVHGSMNSLCQWNSPHHLLITVVGAELLLLVMPLPLLMLQDVRHVP